jgi:hypothetical protein
MQRQATAWEKGLISRIYEELKTLNTKRVIQLINEQIS